LIELGEAEQETFKAGVEFATLQHLMALGLTNPVVLSHIPTIA